MRYQISGKGISIKDSVKEAIERKIDKLEKYLSDDTLIHVTLSEFKGNDVIEVTIPIKGTLIRAEQTSSVLYDAIDDAVDILEKQLLKHRKKLITRHRNQGAFKQEFFEEAPEEVEETIEIVRNKRFQFKPMDAIEACMEMELLGHNFFAFLDRDTDKLAVVYKRKDGKFGLIASEE
ncbi:MAG: ribosomal subunit interface protein [Clostridiales bacterium]|nr:MAG: ribosomal subunit interface protein [Clostridiales bacterium]